VKVQEKSYAFPGQTHVREELSLANGRDHDNALHLDDDEVRHYEIDTIIAKKSSSVVSGHKNLPRDGESPYLQLDAESCFVHRFQKARPKNSMNLDCGTDDFRCDRVQSVVLCVSVPRWFTHVVSLWKRRSAA
jgi:hypothetical protein